MTRLAVVLVLAGWLFLVALLGVQLTAVAHVGPFRPLSAAEVLRSDFPGYVGNA